MIDTAMDGAGHGRRDGAEAEGMPTSRARRPTTAELLAMLLASTSAAGPRIGEEVEAAYATLAAAIEGGDARAVAALCAPDATLHPPGGEAVEGRAGVASFLASLRAEGLSGLRLRLIEAEASGDTVTAAAHWWGRDADGVTREGVAIHQFVRRPGDGLELRRLAFTESESRELG